MTEQSSMLFEAPLTTEPVSQLPAPRPANAAEELLAKLANVLPSLPDDIDIDAPLLAIGLTRTSLTGWHRARAIDVLIGGMTPIFQAYIAESGKLRYRRLPPMLPCPGYDAYTNGTPCGTPTRGGVLCPQHRFLEGR